MNDKSLRLLEFDQIRARVAERCRSEEAAAALAESLPVLDAAAALGLQSDVAALTRLIASGRRQPDQAIPSVGQVLPRLGKEGAALALDEAYALGLFVEAAAALSRWLTGDGTDDCLRALAAGLPDCSPVAREVFRVVDQTGELRDLPEFREIKRRLQSLRRELENLASRYGADEETRRMLQSEVPSQRDGRLVLAVKANYRGRIKGIVHEVSATGQTVFIEPAEVVEKNNDLLIEERRLAAEVARVLRELTERVGVHAEDLAELRRRTVVLDGLRARARYSAESRGVFALAESGRGGTASGAAATPALSRSGGLARPDDAAAASGAAAPGSSGSPPPPPDAASPGRLELVQARHPLLGSKAVPIDLAMDEATRVVIVTGPNTGGKTVALKTVGLFALMNQFGLAVPAAEGTVLPLFDGVWADIGDEQSISQSLSTFSAHMTNMAAICAAAGPRALVLLDELGSGTDPEEGSAIAMSLLDHFIAAGSRVLATTHHGILKNYGYTKAGVVNASADFDARTLSPTYRIIMGVPGESRALDIAARNGLAADIVDRARGYVDEERADVSELIKGLKTKHGELEAAGAEQRRAEAKLREERRRADLKELRLRQKELELRELGVGSLRRLLDESRKTLENLVRELREGELTRDKTLKVKQFLAELDQAVAAESGRADADASDVAAAAAARRAADEAEAEPPAAAERRGAKAGRRPAAPLKVEVGAEVLAGPARRRGKVVSAAKAGRWVVAIGAVRMTLAEADLVPVEPAEPTVRVEIAQADLAGGPPAAFELNLRGMRFEEAMEALRRQLDSAALSGLYEFSVIHGKGDGILQRGVHEYLKKQNVVADYYFSAPEAGGYGKTIVSLKR